MLASFLRCFGPRRRVYLPGLLDHYQPIARGMALLQEAFSRSLKKSQDKGFAILSGQIDTLEAEADRIKRRIRNHLPPAWLMVVDKTLFLNYTRSQDNILDAVQEAATWLALRELALPAALAEALKAYLAEASVSVNGLRPALEESVALILGRNRDRSDVKRLHHAVRVQHQKVSKAKRELLGAAYGALADFRDCYQVIRFVEYVHKASHSAEGCADLLRAMLAR